MEVKNSQMPRSSTLVRDSISMAIIKWLLLLKGFLLEMRVYWVWIVAFSCFNGSVFVLFMWLLGSQGALYAITGSMTMTLASNAALSLGQYIGGLKHANAFQYYATLPISKVAFITSLSTRQLIFSLPSMLFLLFFGKVLFGFQVLIHPVFILITIMGGLSLVGVGALLGFYSPTGQFAGIATQVVQPLITFLAPVFVPYEVLPVFLQKTAIFLPTTYIAHAFRVTLTGAMNSRVYVDLLVLFIWVILSYLLIYPKLDWRGVEQ